MGEETSWAIEMRSSHYHSDILFDRFERLKPGGISSGNFNLVYHLVFACASNIRQMAFFSVAVYIKLPLDGSGTLYSFLFVNIHCSWESPSLPNQFCQYS